MMVKSRKTIAIPPGATIKEQLEIRGMSQKEFALRIGLSEKHVSKLINGDVQLTAEVAIKLEMVLGIPAKFWNNLEAIYREKLIRVKIEKEMEKDIDLAYKMPYLEMVKRGWIAKCSSIIEKVQNLRKFFEVAHLEILNDPLINKIAYRKLSESEKSNYASISWIQKVKLEARNITVAPFSLKKLNSSLDDIRALTCCTQTTFYPRLLKLLSDCGIALVILPHLEGSYLHGATFRDNDKIVLGITVRGKDADRFWFSLFHELGHIICGHISHKGEISDTMEEHVDAFAQNTLIPQDVYLAYISNNDFTPQSILRFAKSINIDAGIVVGRLQKEKLIGYNTMNDLKTKYSICK